MADNTIEVILRLRDEMSKEIGKVTDKLDDVEKSAKSAGSIFKDVFTGVLAAGALQQTADAIARIGTAIVGAASQSESAMAQLDAVLKSTAQAAAQATGGISEEALQKISDTQSKLSDLGEEFARTQTQAQREAASDMADIAKDAAEKLQEIQADHIDRMADLQQSLSDLEEDYQYNRQERQLQLSERLQDMEENYTDRRGDLMEQLSKAETRDERKKIQERLSELDAKHAKEEQRAKEKAAREEARAQREKARRERDLREQMAKEEEEYRKQTAKIKALEQERLQAVKERFSEEAKAAKEAYEKEFGVLSKTIDDIRESGRKAPVFQVDRPTREAIVSLADELEKITPASDDAIISMESLLLTFTNIGADVFPDATRTALDMSVALGQDLKSSAIQLGKALQDPIIGVGALREVGVNFTKSQADMIKKMVEAGDIMGAQKLILKELQIEFGGSAEAAGKTFAGKMAILSSALKDTAEKLAGPFMDNLGRMVDFIVNRVIPVIDRLISVLEKLPEPVQDAILLGGLGTMTAAKIAPSALGIVGLITTLKSMIPAGAGAAAGAAGAAGTAIKGGELAGRLAMAASGASGTGAAAGGGFAASFTTAASAAILPAAVAVGAILQAAMVDLATVSGAKAGKAIGDALGISLPPAMEKARQAMIENGIFSVETWQAQVEMWKAIITEAYTWQQEMTTATVEVLSAVFQQLGPVVQRVFQNISSWGAQMYTNLSTYFSRLASGAQQWGTAMVQGLWTGIQNQWEWLKTQISANMDSLLQWVKDKLGIASPSKLFAEQIGAPLAMGIGAGFERAMGGVSRSMGANLAPSRMALAPSGGGRSAGGPMSSRISVGTIQINGSLSEGERRYFDRRAESISQRSLERVLRTK